MRKRVVRLTLVIACCLAVGVGAFIIWNANRPQYSNITAVKEHSGLALVLPNPLPAGSTIIDQPSYNSTNKSIITRLKVNDTAVTLSQQARPTADLKQIDADDTFLVGVGSVYVLKGEQGHLQAIVQTSDSWLMINASSSIGATTFKTLLDSLRAI